MKESAYVASIHFHKRMESCHNYLHRIESNYILKKKKRQRKYMKNEDSLLNKAFVGLYNIALDLNTFDGTVCVSNKH